MAKKPEPPFARYKCLLCGRSKFQKPTPHKCGNNYLKHYNREKHIKAHNGSIWRIINHLGFSVLG
jgi:hypothetical protein